MYDNIHIHNCDQQFYPCMITSFCCGSLYSIHSVFSVRVHIHAPFAKDNYVYTLLSPCDHDIGVWPGRPNTNPTAVAIHVNEYYDEGG